MAGFRGRRVTASASDDLEDGRHGILARCAPELVGNKDATWVAFRIPSSVSAPAMSQPSNVNLALAPRSPDEDVADSAEVVGLGSGDNTLGSAEPATSTVAVRRTTVCGILRVDATKSGAV